MPGGILQLMADGVNDMFLTGFPEITFFRFIYRRHTNFSMESIQISFDNGVSPNNVSDMSFPYEGDLIHKTYLQITLPKISFKLDTTSNEYIDALTTATDALDNAKTNLRTTISYMKLNMATYAKFYELYSASNVTSMTITDFLDQVYGIFSFDTSETVLAFKNILWYPIPTDHIEIDADNVYANKYIVCIDEILEYYTSLLPDLEMNMTMADFLEEFRQKIEVAFVLSNDVTRQFREILHNKEYLYNEASSVNKKFAWIKNLGFAMIDNIELTIGDRIIDTYYGLWMYIWYELTSNYDSRKLYDRMIGNVPELTTFDRNEKPSYTLMIPLVFPFNRFSGLSLPISALQYNKVNLAIKLKKFSECCYVEHNTTWEPFDLDIEFENANLGYTGSIYAEYIFLDKIERTKFIKSSNEYVIEQLQYVTDEINYALLNEGSLIPTKNISHDYEISLNHPCKYLIWVAQRNVFSTNNRNFNREIRFGNFTATKSNENNPILSTALNFNGYERLVPTDGRYFNYVQPWENSFNSVVDGINLYSFAIKPKELQPSGTCNFTRIKSTKFTFEIDKAMFSLDNIDVPVPVVPEYQQITNMLTHRNYFTENTTIDDEYDLDNLNEYGIKLHMFTVNYNVLRIANGRAGIAYF